MSGQSDPLIGVALGGGSARGLTHIPYIEAMDELGIRPALIAGTSIGALIGSGWAAGVSGAELREHSIKVLGSMRGFAGRVWASQIPDVKSFFKSGLSMQLDAEQVVSRFVPDGFPEDFSGLEIPLHIVATDFNSWHQVVFHTGSLIPAIAGSIAIPSLFRPVEFAGRLLVDGGVVNPLPLEPASHGVDILVGIDVNGDPSKRTSKEIPSAVDVGVGAAQIMMHALTANAIADHPPDVYARPDLLDIGAYEFWRVREIIAHGDKEKDRFKAQLSTAIEAFIGGRQRTL